MLGLVVGLMCVDFCGVGFVCRVAFIFFRVYSVGLTF